MKNKKKLAISLSALAAVSTGTIATIKTIEHMDSKIYLAMTQAPRVKKDMEALPLLMKENEDNLKIARMIYWDSLYATYMISKGELLPYKTSKTDKKTGKEVEIYALTKDEAKWFEGCLRTWQMDFEIETTPVKKKLKDKSLDPNLRSILEQPEYKDKVFVEIDPFLLAAHIAQSRNPLPSIRYSDENNLEVTPYHLMAAEAKKDEIQRYRSIFSKKSYNPNYLYDIDNKKRQIELDMASLMPEFWHKGKQNYLNTLITQAATIPPVQQGRSNE